jgi:hypothetical protein
MARKNVRRRPGLRPRLDGHWSSYRKFPLKRVASLLLRTVGLEYKLQTVTARQRECESRPNVLAIRLKWRFSFNKHCFRIPSYHLDYIVVAANDIVMRL